jgi:hypothetical protein
MTPGRPGLLRELRRVGSRQDNRWPLLWYWYEREATRRGWMTRVGASNRCPLRSSFAVFHFQWQLMRIPPLSVSDRRVQVSPVSISLVSIDGCRK